jgi:hypothetical protein
MPARIDMPLGSLPPNYVHTWTLDLKQIESFRFGFQQWVSLDWASGDRVHILGGCGKVLRTFADQTDFFWAPVVVDPACCAVPDPSSWRIYLLLETSPTQTMRVFSLESIEDLTGAAGAQALLLGDDLGDPLRTVAASPIGQATRAGGALLDMWAPWHVGNPQSPGKRIPSPVESSAFEPSEDWRLLEKNFSDPANGFFSLVYYNDVESRLRFYLLNDSLTQNVTGFRAEVRLESLRGADGYLKLSGAFFPVDPDPASWSSASVLIGDWSPNKWTCFEVPVLYPMAKSVPANGSVIPNKPAHHYFSVYEEQFRPGERNVRVVVSVKGYLELKEDLRLEGKAIGHALQTMEDQGADPLWAFKTMYESIKTGVEWYKPAADFTKGIQDYATKNPNAPGIESVKALAALGSALSPALGLAGALVSFCGLLDSKEPLRLALDLSLKGVIQGTSYTEVVSRESWFFLPGRFSIGEAFDQSISGTPAVAGGFLAAILARYGGTLGLFGFQFNPSVTRFPMAALGKVLDQAQAGYIFPSRKVFGEPAAGSTVVETVPGRGYRRNIAGLQVPLLPVIYNPYGMGMREPGETISLPTIYLEEGAETVPEDGFSHIFVKVFPHPEIPANTFAALPGEDGIPDFPPVTFPYGSKIDASKGLMLEFIGHHRPQLYRAFVEGQVGYVMTRNPNKVAEMDQVRHRKVDAFVSNYYHVKMLPSDGVRPQAHQYWHIVLPSSGRGGTAVRRTLAVYSPLTAVVTVYRFQFDGSAWKLVIEDPADKERPEKNLLVS